MSCSEKIMHSEHSNRVSRAFSLLPGVLAIMAGSFFGFAARLEAAEKYSELPGLQLSSEERKLARQYGKGDVDAGDRAAQTAFRKSVENELRRLTQLGEMARYGDIRKTIYNSYLAIYKPETKAARAVAIDRIVFYANGVAKSKSYSPQSRINFVALLAELDDQPRARAAPPLPAAAAFQPLYEIANAPAMPLYLRAVALHGLERQISVRWHAPGTAGWNDTQKQAVQKMLTDILASKPASALDYKSHQWVARRALDCLAAAESPAALDLALANLGDPESATNMRLTSAHYLCQLDASTFTDEQKSSYLVGLAHFARSELVKWYEREDNILKRSSGASGYGGGGYGDYGGGGMGGYGDSGGDFGAGGGMGGYGGGDDMGMGGYGGGYGSSPGNKKVKAVDTQTWQTILARRRANEICQAIRLCLSGSPAAETTNYKGKVGTVLADAQLPTEQQTLVDEFVTAVDTLQEAVNDVEAVTDVNKLLQGSMVPIEDIMDLVLDIPGFAEQYPDLMEGEELEAVPDAPAQPEAGEGDDPAAEGAEPAAGAEAAAEPAGN